MASVAAGYDNGISFPSAFCTLGLNTALIISLLVDLGFQIYMLFLNCWFSKRLEHYNNMRRPFCGYYNA